MMQPIRFVILSRSRADLAVATELTELSRRETRELFEQGRVRVNGRVARKGDIVSTGQTVEVAQLPASRAPIAVPLDVEAIYSDAYIVAINKPAPLATHPLVHGESDTAANWLVYAYPETRELGDDPREAGWVHRLDRGTSGVLVAALDRETWTEMRGLFRDEKIEKRYLALVRGRLGEGESRARLLWRGTKSRVSSTTEGLRAITRWCVREHFGSATLLEVEIETGRTHQIRAHLAHVGHPIVGDALYGGEAASEFDGQFLHAHQLSFQHPKTGGTTSIVAKLPSDRVSYLKALTKEH